MENLATARSGTSHYTSALQLRTLTPPGSSFSSSAPPEQQKEFAIKGSYLPTLKSLYDDPEVKNTVPTVRLAPEALANTVPRPVSPVYSDMSLEMAEQFNASLSGDISPEEAARTLKEQLERFIKEGQQT